MNDAFKLKSKFKPAGDQPKAIKALIGGIKKGLRHQTLFGVTGSGKTFTVANVIEKIQKPTLVIAHNKTLAAQLAQEYKEFFPDSAVHYFVSYYDYYQPEAYMKITDTYIEKEAQINDEIDRLRHAATQALLTRRDVIVVASVSCIYGLGNPKEYGKVNLKIEKGMAISRSEFIRKLVTIYFERTTADLTPGKFRAIGNSIEIMPANEKAIYRLEIKAGTKGNIIENILKIDAISMSVISEISSFFLFPGKHFITPLDERKRAIDDIKAELKVRLKYFEKKGVVLEGERLKRRTNYDIAMIREIGYCSGIENYSRHFDGRKKGEPPYTLLSYFKQNNYGGPKDHIRTNGRHSTIRSNTVASNSNGANFLTVIDESHVTVPQLSGMYAGDKSRKESLVEYGFRLPSAIDNRPLNFEEFEERVGQVIYTSATPGNYELERSNPTDSAGSLRAGLTQTKGQVVEQIIRPTGLIDPEINVRPIIGRGNYKGQIADLIKETEKVVLGGGRVLVTTLTKKMAEDLSEFLNEKGVKAEYLHSDIKTIDRIIILTDFRKGIFDCLVGVNLLREGLDLPEVEFVGILDADKEGFLRSETSLIQTIGRAARNVKGHVILYAERVTNSMKKAIDETNRRRKIQLEYNKKHNITPKTISKAIKDITDQLSTEHQKTVGKLLEVDEALYKKNPKKVIKEKERQMSDAVKILDFETAAILRDEIRALKAIGQSKSNTSH